MLTSCSSISSFLSQFQALTRRRPSAGSEGAAGTEGTYERAAEPRPRTEPFATASRASDLLQKGRGPHQRRDPDSDAPEISGNEPVE